MAYYEQSESAGIGLGSSRATPTPPNEAPLSLAINRLVDRTASLEKFVQELTQRLQPVCRPVPLTQTGANVKDPSPSIGTVGDAINGTCIRLMGVGGAIQELLETLVV